MDETRLHLIIPMAGRGSRFSGPEFDVPKPLIQLYGKPFFYWATCSVIKYIDHVSLDFVVLKEHVDDYEIDLRIREFFPEARIHTLPKVTEGAVVTCMEGVKEICDDLPVVFNDCDHLFKSSAFNQFCKNGFDDNIDGALLTFPSEKSCYSFVKKDDAGNVICTVEKEAVSKEAVCGCYYFRNKTLFQNTAEEYLQNCNYKEFYMSGLYNVLIARGKRVISMPVDIHVPFGVPEEYREAAKEDRKIELLL